MTTTPHRRRGLGQLIMVSMSRVGRRRCGLREVREVAASHDAGNNWRTDCLRATAHFARSTPAGAAVPSAQGSSICQSAADVPLQLLGSPRLCAVRAAAACRRRPPDDARVSVTA